MNAVDIINKKRLKNELTYDEIKYMVDGFVSDEVKDYQMSALCMAICINGMSLDETINLTDIMLKTGKILDLSSISNIVVDKHSTGGVGDKTTLVLAPLVASCDIDIAKMSGRGLGHTGGTIDKLESIKGFNVNLSSEEFIKQVKEIHTAIIYSSNELVPADKLMYALRDVTGTVESIPLIASSIMSKKIASGSNKIVIDVKVGNGALMKNKEDARELANIMIEIGKRHNVEVICVLSNMDEPLGYSIGNSLEVLESIEMLKGNGPKDLEYLVVTLGSLLVSMAKNISKEEAKNLIIENLNNGKAYAKFEELIKRQNGSIDDIKISDKVVSIKSNRDGFITHIDAHKMGELTRTLGAGRYKKDDVIDYEVGMVLSKKVGDYVLENEELVKVYLNDSNVSISDILDCFTIKEDNPGDSELIIDILK